MSLSTDIKKSSPKAWGESIHLLHGINRDVVQSHVKTMDRSLQLMGQTRPIITSRFNFVDGVMRRYVIDGQHLGQALYNRDEEMEWMDIKVASEVDLITKLSFFNATSKSWMLSDYVKSWSWLEDKEDFKRLLKLHNMLGTSVNTLVMNLSLIDPRASKAAGHPVKNGTFEIKSVSIGTKCAKEFAEVTKVLPSSSRVSIRLFCKAFSYWFHEHHISYDQAKFIKHVQRNLDIIRIFDDSNDEAVEFMNNFGGRGRIIQLTGS